MILSFFVSLLIVSHDSTPVITGKKDLLFLMNKTDYAWFEKGYNEYQPDAEAINLINKIDWSKVNITVFGGSWCDDTQNLLPKFARVCDLGKIPYNKIELYFVDRKKQCPEMKEDGFKPEKVPTFIISREGKEIGRIVESVTGSIESDLLKILSE